MMALLTREGYTVMCERLQELQALLYREIPITQHFNLRVANYDGSALRLDAPLAANVNHKGTAFGGSLSALLTLAGWSMVWLLLQDLELQGETIIQDSHCYYKAPVTGDFSAYCYRPRTEQIQHFARMLQVHRKGRLELNAEIIENGKPAVVFQGRYVVFV